MTAFDDKFDDGQVDRAIADRLAKLRTMPVDTSRLEQAMRGEIPAPRSSWVGALRIGPFRAVAASIAILLIISAVLLTTATGPALASPAQINYVRTRSTPDDFRMCSCSNHGMRAPRPRSPETTIAIGRSVLR